MSGVVRPSKIIERENEAVIIVCNRKGHKKCEIIIDLCDIKYVKKYRWHTTSTNHPRTTISGIPIYLHRLILKTDYIVDHINKNPLDNRRKNLRIADLSLNRINSKTNKNNTSGFRGVLYRKKTGKWEANIRVDGKKIYLAESKDKNYAIQKRLEAEKEFFKNKEVNV